MGNEQGPILKKYDPKTVNAEIAAQIPEVLSQIKALPKRLSPVEAICVMFQRDEERIKNGT